MTKEDPENHYYDIFGNQCHNQPDGSATTEFQAKMQKLYPSVTSILDVLHEEYLTVYKQRQTIKAVLHGRERVREESEKEYEARILKEADADSKSASDWGSEVHEVLRSYFQDSEPIPQKYRIYTDPGLKWIDENVEEIIAVETVVVSPDEGYAGQVDLAVKTKEFLSGKPMFAVLDWKNKRTHPRYPVECGPKYKMQIAAYGVECFNGQPFWGANLVLSSTEPGRFEPVVYTSADTSEAWKAFLAARDLWIYTHWDPRRY